MKFEHAPKESDEICRVPITSDYLCPSLRFLKCSRMGAPYLFQRSGKSRSSAVLIRFELSSSVPPLSSVLRNNTVNLCLPLILFSLRMIFQPSFNLFQLHHPQSILVKLWKWKELGIGWERGNKPKWVWISPECKLSIATSISRESSSATLCYNIPFFYCTSLSSGSPKNNFTARFQCKCTPTDESAKLWNLPQEDFDACDSLNGGISLRRASLKLETIWVLILVKRKLMIAQEKIVAKLHH